MHIRLEAKPQNLRKPSGCLCTPAPPRSSAPFTPAAAAGVCRQCPLLIIVGNCPGVRWLPPFVHRTSNRGEELSCANQTESNRLNPGANHFPHVQSAPAPGVTSTCIFIAPYKQPSWCGCSLPQSWPLPAPQVVGTVGPESPVKDQSSRFPDSHVSLREHWFPPVYPQGLCVSGESEF